MNIVLFWVAGFSFVTGLALSYMIAQQHILKSEMHRDEELKEARAEIKRLRAQVALHVGR